MLAVDLIRHRDDHEPSPGEATKETLIWISFGLAFGVVVAVAFGSQAFGEYISGYLIEKSLSVDNVFVWSIIFSTMAIPLKYQHRVLFWGIFGALALRLVFIFAGSALISRFCWLLLVFGVFLVYTGIKSSATATTRARARRRQGWACCAGSCRSPTSSTGTSSSPS